MLPADFFQIVLQEKYFEKLDKFKFKDDPKLKEKFMGRIYAPIPEHLEEGFTNFQKLLTQEGGQVTVLQLTEGKEIEWNKGWILMAYLHKLIFWEKI